MGIIKVAIADDHKIFRKGVILSLRPFTNIKFVQELINNILKHSSSSFIHLTQNVHGDKFYLRIHHDGRGIIQADFEKLNKSNIGLGLKNISSRLRVARGSIYFEKDISQTYYKVTIELPKDNPY